MSNRECKVRERGDDQHISVATTEAPLRHKADRTVIPGLWHVSHGYKQLILFHISRQVVGWRLTSKLSVTHKDKL